MPFKKMVKKSLALKKMACNFRYEQNAIHSKFFNQNLWNLTTLYFLFLPLLSIDIYKHWERKYQITRGFGSLAVATCIGDISVIGRY